MTSSWNRYHATEHQHVKLRHKLKNYRQTANIRSTKSQNINVFRLVLQLSLPKPSKPVVQSRMKIWLNQRRQAILQLHLRDHQFYCLLMWLILEVWRYGNTSPPVYATKNAKSVQLMLDCYTVVFIYPIAMYIIQYQFHAYIIFTHWPLENSISLPLNCATVLYLFMMTSSNGSIVRVTNPLWGKFTGHQWIPLAKASDAELWCFLWSAQNKRLSKQSRCPWFKTPSDHYDFTVMLPNP